MKQQKINEVMAELQTKVSEGNALIKDKKPTTVAFLESFKPLEKEAARLIERELYATIGKKDKPIVSIVKQLEFLVPRITTKRDKDSRDIVEFELGDRLRQIDILKFCEQNKLPTAFKHKASELNQILCLKVAYDLNLTKAEINTIADTFFMQKEVDRLKGDTKISNNTMTKKLKEVFDSLLPHEDCKVTNHDINYILQTYTKKGKKALSVAVAKDGYLRTLITLVLYKVLTGGTYSVDYQQIKEAKDSATKPILDEQVSKILTEVLGGECQFFDGEYPEATIAG